MIRMAAEMAVRMPSIRARSESSNSPTRHSEATRQFSSTMASEFIPLRTQVTSFCSHSHLKARAAALRGEDYKESEAWRRLENEPSTTGHYFRGVE